MSDFVAFFPAHERHELPSSFAAIDQLLRGLLHAEAVAAELQQGAAVLHSSASGSSSQFYACPDGAGWIVLKGIVFDTGSPDPIVTPQQLLRQLIAQAPGDLNRYEGIFALAAWDSRRHQAWVFNDQASMLNLYYGEHDAGLFVTTNALVLARALALPLDPQAVQEFLARGVLLTPATMFAGLHRVDVGEHLVYQCGSLTQRRHWQAYAPEVRSRSIDVAAAEIASVIVDRVGRYTAVASPVVSDLTGGFDSRLVAAAIARSGHRPGVTVNGPPDLDDVRVAKKVAATMGWQLTHYDTRSFWSRLIDPAMRRELLYHTSGELRFSEVYHHLLSRPLLAQHYGLHMIGSGGELLRYFPWSHEFFGIGRRQPANVERAIKYRFLGSLPQGLFAQPWLNSYRDRLQAQIARICAEGHGTRTTQQLDAVYTWKMTSHSSLYLSSVYNWLPSVAPLLSAGVIHAAVALPWTQKLTSQLQRAVIQQLSPRAAAVVTSYGATAEPLAPQTLHLELWQLLRRGWHMAESLERVALKGMISQRLPQRPPVELGTPPFLTAEFRASLCPECMLSRALYTPSGLAALLTGDDDHWRRQATLILRLATVEELCRELQFEPAADFLTTAGTQRSYQSLRQPNAQPLAAR